MKSGILSDCFSDHCIIYCVLKINTTHLPPKFIKVNTTNLFNSDNLMHAFHNINLNRLNLTPFVNDAWEYFSTEILNIINKHSPLRVIKVKDNHSPWVSWELVALFKPRDRAWERNRLTQDIADWESYKHLRNPCTTQLLGTPNQTIIKTVLPIILITLTILLANEQFIR